MNFFKKSKDLIVDCSNEDLIDTCGFIEDTYKEFKKILVSVTLQLEKSIQNEYDKSFVELLDEIFYNEVLYPSKIKIKSNPDTSRLMSDYKGNKYFRGTESSIEILLLNTAGAFSSHSTVKKFVVRDGNNLVARFALIHDYRLAEYIQVSFFEAQKGLGDLFALIRKEIAIHLLSSQMGKCHSESFVLYLSKVSTPSFLA